MVTSELMKQIGTQLAMNFINTATPKVADETVTAATEMSVMWGQLSLRGQKCPYTDFPITDMLIPF